MHSGSESLMVYFERIISTYYQGQWVIEGTTVHPRRSRDGMEETGAPVLIQSESGMWCQWCHHLVSAHY